MEDNKILRSNIRASVRNFARFNQWDSSSVDKCVDAIIEHFEIQLPTEEEIIDQSMLWDPIDVEHQRSFRKGAQWYKSKLK